MAIENNIGLLIKELMAADPNFKTTLRQMVLSPAYGGNQVISNIVAEVDRPKEASKPKEEQYDIEAELTMAELLQPDRKLTPAEEALKNLLEFLFSPDELAEMSTGDVRNASSVLEKLMLRQVQGLTAEYEEEQNKAVQIKEQEAAIEEAIKEPEPELERPELNEELPDHAKAAVVDVNVGLGNYQHQDTIAPPDKTPNLGQNNTAREPSGGMSR